MPRYCVLIPVYNHGSTLRNVVERALKYCDCVLVVDDGSTDGGLQRIQDIPCVCERLPRNGGKGAAILHGARRARTLGATHIITLDADGQHYPEDLPRMVAAIHAHPHAFIVGARDFATPHVPQSSRFGRAFSGFWMRVQTGIAVSDMQSGFRAYPLEALHYIHTHEKGYAFEVEVLVRAAWAGFAIEEVPVAVHYPKAEERISHFKAIKDNATISLLNTRLTIRALVPIPYQRFALQAEGRLSVRRPLHSLRFLLNSDVYKSTPWHLAQAAAVSITISTLPVPGLQSVLLLLCIGWWRLNRLCALMMIPLTWPPVVPALAILVGYRIRHGNWLTTFNIQTLGYEAGQRFLDWVYGSVLIAPFLGILGGAVVGTMAYALKKSLVRVGEV